MIEHLETAARILWEKKEYRDSAEIMKIASKYVGNDQMLDAILKNIIMCYFHANDVPAALEHLELREKNGFATDWQSRRDKANYLRYLDRHSEAYEIVKQLPDNDTKYLAYSWFLHKEGRFKEAFEMAERGRKEYWWGPRKPLKLPVWDGEFTDKIVITGESGSGDEIIFARWIPKMKQYCDHLYYYTNSSLSEVFEKNFEIEPYDARQHPGCVMAPSMSLPYLLKVEDLTPLKYLSTDPASDRYSTLKSSQNKKIGLCFHGEKTHYEANLRTIPYQLLISAYQPLGDLINLQKDSDYQSDLLNYFPMNSWSDTLLLIDACDIVVTCDTSIAHAAGALGKPTIVLTHAAAYFTWNHNEKIGQSMWYENAWCVHQTEPCDWSGCVEKSVDVARQLLAKDDLK
jgi:hypothetical protein